MATEVVADAGPLIHLTQADALSLLGAFDSVAIPKTVIEEIGDRDVLDALEDVRYSVEPVDYTDGDYPTLDPGETAAIRLAADRGSILLTDDLAAREVADGRGIEVHGSIGVVLNGYARNQLTKAGATELIRALKRDTSLYLADPLVEYALRQIETDYSGWE